VRTGFTVSVLLGLAVASVLAASAPWAALMLRNQQVSPVLRALAAGFVLSGTAVVAGALLRRRLDFKPQFFIEVVSYVLGYGAITCALALRGYGVWSLVIGSLVQTLIASVAQLVYVRHSIRPCLARRELEQLLHFGVGSAASACVNYGRSTRTTSSSDAPSESSVSASTTGRTR